MKKAKEHWSEWFDWTMVDIYETMYHEVNNGAYDSRMARTAVSNYQ